MSQYQLIVIGGGPGGYAAAVHAAKHGLSTALVEKDRLGGTCLHRGCIPTKAYLHATEAAQAALPLAPRAVEAFDWQGMLAQKDQQVEQLTQGLHQLMKQHHIAVYQGRGVLASSSAPFQVAVQGGEKEETLTADRVLLATGSVPTRLPVPGCDSPAVWTSDDLLGPAGGTPFSSLGIVGGGVIGVEMACVYARLGVQVTIVEAEKSCLPMMDRELSRGAEAQLKALGVQLWTGARLQAVEEASQGFTLRVERNGEQSLSCQRVLLATGRRAQTEGLLPCPLEQSRGALVVDGHYQTSLPGVYAIGDVNGQAQLAHAAHAQGLAAVSHMLGKPAPMDTRVVPSCVYTQPEIATVGLTQEEAKAQGLQVLTGKALTTQNARNLIEGMGRGFIKLVAEKDSRRLLGAQLLCGRATDLLGELTLAIVKGLTLEDLLLPMRAHPTFYEAVTDAVEAVK